MRPSSSPAPAILLAALGIGLLSLMDATIKGLSDRYGVTEIAFARYLVGTVVMAGVLGALRPGWPSAETWRTNGLRAVLVVATALCFFHGLSVLPLAEALALSFLSPVFIALFAALLLRERVRPPVWAGLVVGFLGVGIVVAGQVGAEGVARGAGSACAGAASAAAWVPASGGTGGSGRSRLSRNSSTESNPGAASGRAGSAALRAPSRRVRGPCSMASRGVTGRRSCRSSDRPARAPPARG